MANWRYSLLVPFVGTLVFSCASWQARTQFEVPDKLPLFQLIVDLDSSLEWEGHQKKPQNEILDDFESPDPPSPDETHKTANFLSGLIVPITADGFCLTAAHNVGKGDAMRVFKAEIGGHDFGRSYTLVDLRNERSSPFFRLEQSGGKIVTANRMGGYESNRFFAREGEKRALRIISRDLDSTEFETMQVQLGAIDAAFLIRLREIKIWSSDDLALVKVPFSTPSHFAIAESEPLIGDRLMVFGNPGVHDGVINYVTKRVERNMDGEFPIVYSDFYALKMAFKGIGRQGDSGGPVINENGELVGINIGTSTDGGGRLVDIATGLRRSPIMDSIQEFRRGLK